MNGATLFLIYPPGGLKIIKNPLQTQINNTLEVDKFISN